MPGAFRRKIRSALADSALQAALDANAEGRRASRIEAYAGLADAEALRHRAHAVRARTIDRLDHYLDQFTDRARSNGLIVHQASSAARAIQLILEIAAAREAQLIAKSKTMVSEEIELNRALEASGYEVVETDLGEYIVQLRGERPAHIITPAVHLNRRQVGAVFHERLGVPPSDDVETLTAHARSALRQTFLAADIGISGVNFGVAESGTLVIVTNEGNGRMVTTLPPVHIALMGIERLVPTFDDLALLLALLPRAATGQKITVYTSLINSPRRAGDPDGPEERHVILVDNGRSALRSSALAEALYCIRCGACLNACPIFREIGGHAYVDRHGEPSVYSGPIGSIISPGLFGQSEFGHLARATTLCGACKEACPVNIDLPKLLLRTRAGGRKIQTDRTPPQVPRRTAWALKLYTWLATEPRRFALAQRLAALLARAYSPRRAWIRMPAFTGWGPIRAFPRPARKPFRQRAASLTRSQAPAAGLRAGLTAARAGGQSSRAIGPALPGTAGAIARFEAELTALGATFTRCEPGRLSEVIASRLNELGISQVYSWARDRLPPGLVDSLLAAGIEAHPPADSWVRSDWVESDRLAAGLTGALAAVADTGTVVLPGGPGRPLTVSLLPPVHLVIVQSSQVYTSLQEVLRRSEIRLSPAVALISGPSRTADIEMTLTIGVHGPRQVHVFCVENT